MLKANIERGFHLVIIAVLAGCTAMHPETISEKLGPNEQEKFQRDFRECDEFAESKRPSVTFIDIWLPIGVAIMFALVGYGIEYHSKMKFINDYKDPPPDQHYKGNVLLGFSLTGVAIASGMVAKGMISRQA